MFALFLLQMSKKSEVTLKNLKNLSVTSLFLDILFC